MMGAFVTRATTSLKASSSGGGSAGGSLPGMRYRSAVRLMSGAPPPGPKVGGS